MMTYKEMSELKKGDKISVLRNGEWITGEVASFASGIEPAIWLTLENSSKELKIYTGLNFVESFWTKAGFGYAFTLQEQSSEQLNLEIRWAI